MNVLSPKILESLKPELYLSLTEIPSAFFANELCIRLQQSDGNYWSKC